MKNLFNKYVAKLTKELEARGIVHEAPDYDPKGIYYGVALDNVYRWGFTTISYCEVTDPVITFYDWKYQEMLSLDIDDNTTYRLYGRYLYVTQKDTFHGYKNEFRVDLERGALVHVEDVVAIGYKTIKGCLNKRFYILKDRLGWLWEDGVGLRPLEGGLTADDFVEEGYTLVDPASYMSNLVNLNNHLYRSKSC